MRQFVFLALASSLIALSAAECPQFKFIGDWNGGRQGEIVINPTDQAGGYEITLEFSKPVTAVENWSASQTTTSNSVTFNSGQHTQQGGRLALNFLYRFNGPASTGPRIIGVIYNNQRKCGEGGSSGGGETTTTTTTTTTQGPTTPAGPTTTIDPNPNSNQELDPTGEVKFDIVPASTGPWNYNEVLMKSMLFYEAQRSGDLPADNRILWRGDSALQDPVVGGYYDAGDYVKFGFPLASSITHLAWGAISFMDGYVAADQVIRIIECLQWATDYFVRSHPSPSKFIGQVGNGHTDHMYWGPPETMPTTDRNTNYVIQAPSQCGADLAAETAAALAASSMVYNMIAGQGAKADEALEHARDLFAFAESCQGTYDGPIGNAGDFYKSWSGYKDELVWAAAWMYKATGEASFKTKAENWYSSFSIGSYTPKQFSWDNKIFGAEILLWEITGKGNNVYKNHMNAFIDQALNGEKTPLGLFFLDGWGTLRHAANVAHAFFQIAKLGHRATELETAATKQINYMLGGEGAARSYVVGFGNNPPTHAHHRAASCPSMNQYCGYSYSDTPADNPHIIYGALVGGPDKWDNYQDDRTKYERTEVAVDYNAGFQSAVAALAAKNAP